MYVLGPKSGFNTAGSFVARFRIPELGWVYSLKGSIAIYSAPCLGKHSSNVFEGGQSFSFSISGHPFLYLRPSKYPLKNWKMFISTCANKRIFYVLECSPQLEALESLANCLPKLLVQWESL